MDPRRRLIAATLAPVLTLALGGCAALAGRAAPDAPAPLPAAAPLVGPTVLNAPAGPTGPAPVLGASSPTERPYLAERGVRPGPGSRADDPAPSATALAAALDIDPAPTHAPAAASPTPAGTAPGPAAIARANAEARARSRSDQFVGGVQVFGWEPGRIYEVWTAPLRVTTLTLAPGETVVSKAAGDTVRWQIGETATGEGLARRALVMIKPLERGLETNLVLATSRRLYHLHLRSGGPDGFNAAVAWDLAGLAANGSGANGSGADGNETSGSETSAPDTATGADPLVQPTGPLDARFRIESRGRRPAWTPTAVVTDGTRTFLHFPPGLEGGEAPALFALGPDGQIRTVNYRQQGGLWVVDGVLDEAELRLGGSRPRIVRITRLHP